MADVDIGGLFQLLGTVASETRETRREVDSISRDMATKKDVANVVEGLDSLKSAVTNYHASVIGHGILISELDERGRRIERHLGLPPAAAE